MVTRVTGRIVFLDHTLVQLQKNTFSIACLGSADTRPSFCQNLFNKTGHKEEKGPLPFHFSNQTKPFFSSNLHFYKKKLLPSNEPMNDLCVLAAQVSSRQLFDIASYFTQIGKIQFTILHAGCSWSLPI